jgi:hypothetical protein
MQMNSILLNSAALIAAMTLGNVATSAQALPCSWPLETTGSGISNVAYPDTNATYWTMPFNSERWQSIVIKGTYPQARFFSFISYVAKGSVVDNDNGSLIDKDIRPDDGSTNPFVTTENGPHNYTITVGSSEPSDNSNFLSLGNTRLVWVIYRIYVPNKGLNRQAGVPLPTITVVSKSGESHTLAACSSESSPAAVVNVAKDLVRQGLKVGAVPLHLLSGGTHLRETQQAVCQPTPLVSWIPADTGGYFPNTANKYIAIPGLCISPGQVLVVRGKAPTFPETYNGGPIWEPPSSNMRYWSACNNNQRVPYPVVGCKADYQTNLDAGGYYTYVVSKPEGRNLTEAPYWVPPDATWLPWGSKRSPNILILRNMLPASTFSESVQDAISHQPSCVVDNTSTPVPRDKIIDGGECAQSVMKDYYPAAVYCNKQLFISQGWQGCFAAATSSR